MQTTNDRMTKEQVTDLLNLAAHLQAKAESSDDRDTAVMAYAVQKVCLELTESRLTSKASEQQLAAVVSENAGLKASRPQPFGPEVMKALDAYEKHQDEVPETGMLDAYFILRDSIRVETPATDAYQAECGRRVWRCSLIAWRTTS